MNSQRSHGIWSRTAGLSNPSYCILKSLESIPFDASQPLFTYNLARDMLITQGIAALNPGHDGPRFAEQLPVCELIDLPRLASRVSQRLLFSMGTEVMTLRS